MFQEHPFVWRFATSASINRPRRRAQYRLGACSAQFVLGETVATRWLHQHLHHLLLSALIVSTHTPPPLPRTHTLGPGSPTQSCCSLGYQAGASSLPTNWLHRMSASSVCCLCVCTCVSMCVHVIYCERGSCKHVDVEVGVSCPCSCTCQFL